MTADEAVREAQPIVSEVVGLLTFLADQSVQDDKDRRPDVLLALLRLLSMAEDMLTDVHPVAAQPEQVVA